MNRHVQHLLDRKDVHLPLPESVFIGDEVSCDAIAPGVTIHPGCRIRGAKTSIGPDSVLGEEAPVTIEDCQLASAVHLKGGFASGSVFLHGASMGSGMHARPGTILEEFASGAHSCGFKQTIFFPWATSGSLVNFCDLILAGGTGPKDHSEVGSSYVHFNFTPHGDKATASLLGDVARGVFLQSDAIFLGGQGGLVGPVAIAYGTVLGAGSVHRCDVETEGRLIFPAGRSEAVDANYQPGIYRNVRRRVDLNFRYIANVMALKQWYQHVRLPLAGDQVFQRAAIEGGLRALSLIIEERLKWLGKLGTFLQASLDRIEAGECEVDDQVLADHRRFVHHVASWVQELTVKAAAEDHSGEKFCAMLPDEVSPDAYTAMIQGLKAETVETGSQWMESLVADVWSMWHEFDR